jgi:hypothetical protein
MRLDPCTGSRLLPVLLLVLLPAAAHAQGWSLDLSAGQAVYDPLETHIASVNAALGLRYGVETRRWLYLSAGADLAGEGPHWGAGGAGTWLGVERGSLSVGTRLGVDLFGYTETEETYGGGGATLEVMPTLLLRQGRGELELHAGVLQTGSTSAGLVGARSAFDGGARALLGAAPGVRLGAEARYLRVPEGGRPYVGVSAQVSRGPGSLWGFAGHWLEEDSTLVPPYTGYGVGGSVRVPGGAELVASWQQEPPDPFYLSAGRRTWSVRVSRALGGRRAPAPAELPLPSEVADGRVTLRLPVSEHPEPPSVVGDFTGWQPVPLVRVGELWEVRLAVAPGVHHYHFRTPEGRWFVPASLHQVDDGMGGTSAVLVVP